MNSSSLLEYGHLVVLNLTNILTVGLCIYGNDDLIPYTSSWHSSSGGSNVKVFNEICSSEMTSRVEVREVEYCGR